MTPIPFTHAIGDHVVIPTADNTPARVTGLCRQVEGDTYRVIWWQDGKRCDEWVREWEIVKAPAGSRGEINVKGGGE